MTSNALSRYNECYADPSAERLGLFTLMAERFACKSALYPGSFDHVTPAFVFPNTCFVDMDTEAARFFADPSLSNLVAQRKAYPKSPCIRFYAADYEQALPEADRSFDLLISLNAGFVSQYCKRYLKGEGILLVNNLHGDASMARLDPDYEFLGAVNQRSGTFRLVEQDLASFFVPKLDQTVSREQLERTRRGVAYTRRAFAYVFRQVG